MQDYIHLKVELGIIKSVNEKLVHHCIPVKADEYQSRRTPHGKEALEILTRLLEKEWHEKNPQIEHLCENGLTGGEERGWVCRLHAIPRSVCKRWGIVTRDEVSGKFC